MDHEKSLASQPIQPHVNKADDTAGHPKSFSPLHAKVFTSACMSAHMHKMVLSSTCFAVYFLRLLKDELVYLHLSLNYPDHLLRGNPRLLKVLVLHIEKNLGK